MADLSKKLRAVEMLSRAAPKPAVKNEPVLVLVPHVPAPDRIPEDRPIHNLVLALAKHFQVHVMAGGPAPLEDPYRRGLLMEGVVVKGGQPLSGAAAIDPKQEMHNTPFRAVFVVTHDVAEKHMRDLTLFSPQTPFFLFLPTVWHLRRLKMEKSFLKRRSGKDWTYGLYRLPKGILVSTPADAEALRVEVNSLLHPQPLPSLGQAEMGDWLRSLVNSFPRHRKPPALKKLVSIVMLCHNDGKYLRRCLASLKRFTQGIPHELIFVDNASKDGSPKLLRRVRGAKVILNPSNLAFAKGNNQGVQLARGEYVLLLNPDIVLTEGWLEKMLACAESDPSVGLVGPLTNSASAIQTVPAGYRSLRDLPRYALALSLKYRAVWEDVHRLIGFCLLVKREVLQKVGLLDERFGPGGYEDYDFCLRARQAGYKLKLCRDVYIHHFGGKGYVGMNYDGFRNVNRELFIEKWCRKSLEFLEEAGL